MKLILVLIGLTLASSAAFGTTVIEFDAVTGKVSVDGEPQSDREVEVPDINDVIVRVARTNTFLYTVTPSSTYSSIDRWKEFREAVTRITSSTSFVNTAVMQLVDMVGMKDTMLYTPLGGRFGDSTTRIPGRPSSNWSIDDGLGDIRRGWREILHGRKSLWRITSTIDRGMLEIHHSSSHDQEWQATQRLKNRLAALDASEFGALLASFIDSVDRFILKYPDIREESLKAVMAIRDEALALMGDLSKVEPILDELFIVRNQIEIRPPGHSISDNVREITISHEAIDEENARRLVLFPQKTSIRLRKESSAGIEPHIGVSLVVIPPGIVTHTFKPSPQENGEVRADTVSTERRYYDYALNLGVQFMEFGGGLELLLNPVDDIRFLGLGGFMMIADHVKFSVGGCVSMVEEVNRESLLRASSDIEAVPTREVLKPTFYVGASFVGWGTGDD